MNASDIMIRDVYKVKETEPVRSAIRKFIEHGISGLPVVNDRNEMVGYISDGDIMRYIGKHKDIIVDMFYFVNFIRGDDVEFEKRVQNILDQNVMSIAQKKIFRVQWDEEVEIVAEILGNKRIKKVPVERNGVLVGIISRGDVIRSSFKDLL